MSVVSGRRLTGFLAGLRRRIRVLCQPRSENCPGLPIFFGEAGWWLRRKAPVFAFSIFWFFITISPTSSVVPIVDVIFEHRLYLPLVGVAFSFPFLVDFLYARLRRRVSKPSVVFTSSSVILMALLAGTVMRNYVWSDEV